MTDLQKESWREEARIPQSTPPNVLKSGGFAPPPPHERSMRNAELNRELEAGAPLGPGGRGPRARLPVRLLRPGVPGSLTGVAMFPKCCDPSGLCSAGNSVRAGGLDDGRYGSEELGLPPEPLRGAAEERGAAVTLHSGQSCRGIPGPHGSTAGIGPLSAPLQGAVCGGSSRSGTCQPHPRTACAPGRCSE